ncbi:hypothetical protein L1987_84227 [Smallanthus sonchifolius]|uniref:Uncharacterized protein n=1 Tax=Smallanthus sonchifolius TaxID=185202 RepID=A0ACB8YEN8_9ASTR|nr:hypothetical protein L1987_84227 [Smallanthus sonchifolius]
MVLQAEPSFKVKFAIGRQDPKSKTGRHKKRNLKREKKEQRLMTEHMGVSEREENEKRLTEHMVESLGLSGMVESPGVDLCGRDTMVGEPGVSDLDPIQTEYAAERRKKEKREEEKQQKKEGKNKNTKNLVNMSFQLLSLLRF